MTADTRNMELQVIHKCFIETPMIIISKVKSKATSLTGLYSIKTLRVPHFLTVGSQTAVSLLALCAGRALPPPPGRFLVPFP
jgi:hypothetical protein